MNFILPINIALDIVLISFILVLFLSTIKRTLSFDVISSKLIEKII